MKAQIQLEWNLVRDVKGNKKGCHKHLEGKGKSRKNVGLMLNEAEDLVTQDTEKAELLNAFSASIFTKTTGLPESQARKSRGNAEARKMYPRERR